MLKSTVKNIITEIEVSLENMKYCELEKETAIEFLELNNLKDDFKKYLDKINKKEEDKKEEK